MLMATLSDVRNLTRCSIAFAELEFLLGWVCRNYISFLCDLQVLVLVLLIQVVSIQWLVECQSKLVLHWSKVLRLPYYTQGRLSHGILLSAGSLILFKLIVPCVARYCSIATSDALLHESLCIVISAAPAARERVLASSSLI